MNKLVIFVEGQTEQIFVEKLIRFLGSERNISIQVQRHGWGGRNRPRTIIKIFGANESTNPDYFILIIDCGQDERVKSDIIERYNGLIESGYQAIVAIRDVYPILRADIQRLRQGFAFNLPSSPVTPVLVLAIMELEAWFLAEYSHFFYLHPNLTIDQIQHELGFNLITDDMQLRDHPSTDLEDIYFLENMYYDKTRDCIERIVNALDFDTLTSRIALGINDLKRLVNTLQHFFEWPV